MGRPGDDREGLMAKALAPGDLEAQPGLWFGYRSQLTSPSAWESLSAASVPGTEEWDDMGTGSHACLPASVRPWFLITFWIKVQTPQHDALRALAGLTCHCSPVPHVPRARGSSRGAR